MKKALIITIILAIILILIFASLGSISFSQTNGNVIDETGEPVVDAKVAISYSCRENKGFVDSDSHSFKTEKTQTNDKGQFSFSSLNIGFVSRLKYSSNCEKTITAFKEGYCRDIQLCTREITSGGLIDAQINNRKADKSVLLFRNGKYFESAYFNSSATIKSDVTTASISLNKFDSWFQ